MWMWKMCRWGTGFKGGSLLVSVSTSNKSGLSRLWLPAGKQSMHRLLLKAVNADQPKRHLDLKHQQKVWLFVFWVEEHSPYVIKETSQTLNCVRQTEDSVFAPDLCCLRHKPPKNWPFLREAILSSDGSWWAQRSGTNWWRKSGRTSVDCPTETMKTWDILQRISLIGISMIFPFQFGLHGLCSPWSRHPWWAA